MPRFWRKADRDLRCGYDWCSIPKGQPYQEIRLNGVQGVMVRCELHAQGPVDLEQLQAAERAEPRPVPAFKRLTEGVRFDPKLAQVGKDE